MANYIFGLLRYLRAEKDGMTIFANNYLISPPPVGEIVRLGFERVKQEDLFSVYPEEEFRRELQLFLNGGASKAQRWRKYVMVERRSRVILRLYPRGETQQCYPVSPFEIFPHGAIRLLQVPRTVYSLHSFIDWHENLMPVKDGDLSVAR